MGNRVGGWAVSQRGVEDALVLSSEASQCPHDPDLRMSTGCHRRKHKGGRGRDARDQHGSHSKYPLASRETALRSQEKMTRYI